MRLNDPHADASLASAGVPLADAAAVVLLLHGRGGSAADILSLGPHLEAGGTPRFAFRALGSGRELRRYPGSFLLPREQNQPHLSSALGAVHRTLDRLAEQAPETPVVVLGFSQGACLAAEFVFRAPGRVTGLVCLTGGLIGDQIEAGGPAAGSAGTPNPPHRRRPRIHTSRGRGSNKPQRRTAAPEPT